MTTRKWWQEPMRVVQMNLQMMDTDRINPEQLAAQVEALGGNTLVFNTGGICAWYDTQVEHHVRNSQLAAGRDLAGEVVEACHRRNIRFVARADFKAAEDRVFLQKPQWFVRKPGNQPDPVAPERPGPWPVLYHTCLNGEYQRDGVAIPALHEIMERFDVDGLFVNSFFYIPCVCESCVRLYWDTYGKELPQDPAEYEPTWRLLCMHRGMEYVYDAVKRKNPDMPMFFYAYPFVSDGRATDLICAEPHNMMSFGYKNLSQSWKPAINMRWARTADIQARPLAIVHSSPGLNWRHTGIQPVEYEFWLSQVAANGGQLWHSLTGIPDTIEDSNILDTVRRLNTKIRKIEQIQHVAKPMSQIAILWSEIKGADQWHAGDGPVKEGWIEGLMACHLPFDLLHDRDVNWERLLAYPLLVMPADFRCTEDIAELLGRYIQQGGRVIAEGRRVADMPQLRELFGVASYASVSEEMSASYLRLESGERNPLRQGLERSDLVPHQGRVLYVEPTDGTDVWATLIPPFAPWTGVGNPPERASLPAPHTDIPLCLHRETGNGRAVYLPFEFAETLERFRLQEYYVLLRNIISSLLPQGRAVVINDGDPLPGLQVSAFQDEQGVLVHLINGIGTRPLVAHIPLHGVRVRIAKLGNRPVKRVVNAFDDTAYAIMEDKEGWTIQLPQVGVWEAIRVEYDDV